MFTALLIIDLIAVSYGVYFAISAARKAREADIMLNKAIEHWDDIIMLTKWMQSKK